jgi:hypothetical protein
MRWVNTTFETEQFSNFSAKSQFVAQQLKCPSYKKSFDTRARPAFQLTLPPVGSLMDLYG